METEEAVAWLMRTLGLKPKEVLDSNGIDNRLKIQKVAYLLKCLGAEDFKSFDFNLYLRGPYSPSLSSEYYALASKRDDEIKRLAQKANDRLRKFAGIVEWFGKYNPSQLEIASTILMFHENAKQISEKLTRDKIFDLVETTKPWASRDLIEKVYDELDEKKLLCP
jgi:uncharacterized protein YwgA